MTTHLETWYKLRLDQGAIKTALAALEEDAIAEDMERVVGEEKKTFPIGLKELNHKIQIRFTNKKIKHTDDQELDNLHAEIGPEREAAATANAAEIAQIEADLDSLTQRLECLKNTDQGRALLKEYANREKLLTEKVPVLALKGV